MKHLKRTVSLCLTLLMILGCLPNLSLTASAANYGVWVLGTRVTDANKGDVLGDGTVSYNPAYQTLYLHDLGLIDASEDNYNSSAIYSNGSLTLVLDGYSAFTGAGFGVRVVGDLYIHGDGRLALSAADSGIYAGGCLYLDDTANVPTVSANGSFYGVRVKSAALLQGTLNALTYGMNEDANATIKNAGIYTYSGALHLGSSDPRCFRNNVHLNAESQNGPAVYAEGRIELSPVLNITQPAEWHLSGDLRTVQDGSDSQATKVLLEPLPSYQITAEAYQGEVVVDQGDRAFVGTTVTISFRPEEDLSLMFLACEDPDDSTPVPVTRDGDSYTFIMPAHNVFIYAEFGDEPGYAVLVDEAMEHGTVSAEQPLYLPGDSVALTVTPEDSYFLRTIRVVNNDDNSEIEITGSGSDWEFEMPEANVTVYASFAQAANSVTLTPNPGCTLYTDRDNTMPGDTVIISAIPAAGWKFNDLIVTDANANEVLTLRSGNEYTFTMPNSAVTVTAACSQASYSVTVQNGSNGSASVNHTEAGYGETVTVTASADSGYRTLVTVTDAFGESVPLEQTGTDTYRFSMPACDVTVLTQSDPTYAITVESSEHGSITASVSQAAAGDRVTLTITPDEGYVFVGTITPQRRDNYEEFTLQDDNSFIMPDSDVLVKVTRTAFSIAGAYDLWLGSTQVTDLNRTDILNNGQASFDPETNLLTLNNLTGTEGGGDYNASIYSGLPKLTILGSGSIQGLNGNNQKRGIYIDGDLVLDGDFTIAGTSNGITNKNQGNVTLWGGTINITGGTRGIYLTPGTLTIRDGIEQVHISGGSQAVSASSGITLESDVQITSPANCVVDGRYFMVGEDKATSVTLSNISNNPRIILLPTAHGTVTADKQRAAAGETVTLTITPDAGYLVGSTYIHAGNTTPPQSDDLHFTMLSTDVTVEVQFVRPSVAVQITAGAHGSVSDQTNSFSDPAGTVKTVDCTPDADYRVDRLVVSGTQDEIPMLSLTTDEFGVSHFTFALPNTDTEATLLFTLQERPVTVIRNAHGSIQADVTDACTGDTVTLSAAANENYKFIGFCVKDQNGSDVTVTQSGESWQFTMPASPVTVTGWFDPAVAYDLYVAGVQVIGLNKDDVLGDGKVSYDPDTQTLTLNGVTGASGSYHSAGVFTNSLDSLTVVSTNSSFASIGEAIAGTYAGPVYGILAENTDVTLQGDLVSSTGCGIVARNVTLASGSLDLPRLGTFTHDMGIRTGTLTISNAFSSLTMTIQGPAMMLDCDSIVLGEGQALIVPSDAEIGTVNHSANYSELTIQPANLHTVTVADSIYGSVGVEKTSYYAGQLVRLTRQPDEDFEITALHVKDAENNDVTVETSDQFIMPDSDVTVTADYRYTGSSKSYDVWIGSTRVTTSNMFNVLSDGKIQYNPSTKTLHLNGVEEFKTTTHDTYGTPIEGVFCMIWSKNDLTVEGTGTFRFTGTVPSTASVSADAIVPIECGGTLTLRGDFTMTGGYHCIQAANVRLEGGIITLTNNYDRYNRSIETNGTLTLGPELERLEINSNRYVFDAGSVSMHRYLRVVDPAGKTISQLNSNANYKHLLVERYDQPVEIHSTNGTVTANVETEVSGQTVTLTLTPDAGCILQSLTVTDESGSPIALRYWDNKADFTMPATKAVVTAVFVSGTHSVTLAEPIHGSLSVERFAYAPGETVTVTAEPETGYALTSLDVFAAKGATQKITDTKQFVMPDNDVTVVATYDVVYYPVTVTESAYGIVTASAETAAWGDTVQLSVFPDEDYELQSMTVQDANNNNVTVTNNSFVMPASAVTVSAVFTEIKYHVSYATVAFGSVSADKTTVLPGETVTLTATPDEGYALERMWVTDTGGSEIPMLSDTTFTMPKMDVVVHATFTAVDYRISTEVSGHGTIRPTVSTANFGQTVTVIAEPETGYVLSSLAVVKAGGGKVDVNARTFGMPSDDVIIRAVFVPQGEENTAYNLWLGDTQVTNANAADILGNGGTSFDPETNTLTLNNPGNWVAGHTALNHKQLIYSENMDLIVKGRANLSTSNERGIYASGGTLTLDGDLKFTSHYEALWAGNIVIAGGTLKLTTTGAFSAIRGDTCLRFENGIVSMEAAGGSGKAAITSGSMYIGDDLAVTNPAGGSHDGSAIYNADGSAYTGSVLKLERRADFAVRIDETENGTVTADPARGNEGDSITLTFTPDTGYQLGTLTVTDSEGNALAVDESCVFTMPAGEARVSASFVPVDYAVNIADSEHGHVTTDNPTAHYQEEVTLTVHPDTGYHMTDLLVDGASLLAPQAVTPALTYLDGSQNGTENGQSRMLLDGNNGTKWFVNLNECPTPYIIYKADIAFWLTDYTLTTAEDTARYPGRNWKNWTIYGANFDSDDEALADSDAWQIVVEVTGDTTLQADNLTPFTFTLSEAAPLYRYYKIVVTAASSGNAIQMSELSMHGSVPVPHDEADPDWTFTMPASDVTVTAEFTAIDYLVAIDESLEHITVTAPETSHYGDRVQLAATPDAGWRLQGFTVTDADGNNVPMYADNSFVMPAKDVTVSAQLSAIDYTISVTAAANGSVTAPATAHAGDEITLTVTPSEGYRLQALAVTDLSGQTVTVTDATFTMPAASVIVSASFAPAEHTISVLPSDNGTVTASTSSAAPGETVTLTITPDAGYRLNKIRVFDYNYQTVEVTDNAFTMPDGNVFVIATFAYAPYAVTVHVTGNGAVTPDKAAANAGETVTLTVVPDEGWKLVSLAATDAAGRPVPVENGCFTMPASDVVLQAAFIPADSFLVTVSPTVNGTVQADQQTALPGETVTLTVTPDAGYRLSGLWAGEVDLLETSIVPTLTYLSGSADGMDNGNTRMLVDGNTATKWYSPMSASPYIIFKASVPFCLTDYTLTTADDTANFGRRNWQDWTIYGANFASDDEAVLDSEAWQTVVSVTGDTTLQAVNLTPFTFSLSEAAPLYQYYKIAVTASRTGQDMQMAELSMCGNVQGTPDETDTLWTFTMPASDVTVTAEFEAIDYTVTVNDAANGSVSADPSTAHAGDVVTLTVTPAEGYELGALTVSYGDNQTVVVENNQFTMPAANVTVTATFVQLPDGYYLIGPDWTVDDIDESSRFAVNPNNGNEFMLETTLAEGDEIKVVHVTNDAIDAWYPDGVDTQYTVDAAHSGEVTVYFKTSYDSAWAAFGGYLYIDRHTNQPMDLTIENTLALNGAITLNYILNKAEVEALGLTDLKVVVIHTAYTDGAYVDESVELTDWIYYDASQNYLLFKYENIAAKELNDKMVAHVEGIKDGITFTSNSKDYNPITYCYTIAQRPTANAALRKTCADLIKYAAAAQECFSYNSANPADADWNDDIAAVATQGDPELAGCKESIPLEGQTADIMTYTLDVSGRVNINYYVLLDDMDSCRSLTLVCTYKDVKGNNVTVEIPGTDWSFYNDVYGYTATLNTVNAGEMREIIAAVVKDANGNVISNTYKTSIETYAKTIVDRNNNPALIKLMKAMLNYGTSANEFLR